jgi:hypothetical protein
MQTSSNGIALIQRFEGIRLTAYRDIVGVLTIGYGHTGPDVTPGLTITQPRAVALLQQDLAKFEPAWPGWSRSRSSRTSSTPWSASLQPRPGLAAKLHPAALAQCR